MVSVPAVRQRDPYLLPSIRLGFTVISYTKRDARTTPVLPSCSLDYVWPFTFPVPQGPYLHLCWTPGGGGGGAGRRLVGAVGGGGGAGRRLTSTEGGRGAGLAWAGGLLSALSALSLSLGPRSILSSNSSQGGSLLHVPLLVHHRATRSGMSNESEPKADGRNVQPQLKQNSILHRHLIWLYPRVRSVIAWHPGHLRHRLDWNSRVQPRPSRAQGCEIPWPTQWQAGLPGIADLGTRTGIPHRSCLGFRMSVVGREDIILVWLTLMPHCLAGYTDPLETRRTLSIGICIVGVDLHQHRTVRVWTISSWERVE